jgi:uncharacterized protein (TIGR02118 family)
MTMIRVSVLYPHKDGGKFDMNYYLNKHMPLVRQRLGAALKGISVEQGIAGGAPNSPAPFTALGHLLFDNVAEFQSGMSQHQAELMADIPNFTNIEPTLQVSEVKM